MPTVYEDPASYGLVLVGELQESHVYAFHHNWRVAVWRDAENCLWYAVAKHWSFTVPPFEGVDSVSKLRRLKTKEDFELFKKELNWYWWGTPHNRTASERGMRNKRWRLRRKVGALLFRSFKRM